METNSSILKFINGTDQSIFLSGKAGTGKTTFLKGLKTSTFKKFVVVAPTGVAAINAGGITIHSFFNLPLMPFLLGQTQILDKIKFDKDKTNLLQHLELLVIDEISMVRADVMDAIDYVLRRVRKKSDIPFGGVQLLLIGDLYQLSPIATGNDFVQLSTIYRSLFFIDSQSYSTLKPLFFELTKIYRQTDEAFVNVLSSIRNNTCSSEEIALLNTRVVTDSTNFKDVVTLTTHKNLAKSLNEKNLNCIASHLYCFDAKIEGEFEKAMFPVDEKLLIKIGAKVMLIKNLSATYFNGKIGTVSTIEIDRIIVDFGNDDLLSIDRAIWNNIDFSYDSKNNNIAENVRGSFQQFPLRLAWAITIHKSQGLTFDNAIIDTSEAFVPGQVYVALSRVKSLEGLILKAEISKTAISVHPRLIEFETEKNTSNDMNVLFKSLNREFIKKILTNYFDWTDVKNVADAYKNQDLSVIISLRASIYSLAEVGEKFISQLENIIVDGNIPHLSRRILSASSYFLGELEKSIINLRTYLKNSANDVYQKRNIPQIRHAIKILEDKSKMLLMGKSIAEGLSKGFELHDILLSKSELNSSSKNNIQHSFIEVLKTEDISLSLFKSGKSIDQIALERKLTTSTIENHLASFLKEGRVFISDIINSDNLSMIIKILEENGEVSLSKIKIQVPEPTSLGQINAAIIYWQMSKY